jgi:hypothetical protein
MEYLKGCGWLSKESAGVIPGAAAVMIRCPDGDAGLIFLKIQLNISNLCAAMYVMANTMTCF